MNLHESRSPVPKGEGKRHEIVRVVEPAFLINADRQACHYETADNQLLMPGYYLAMWPKKVLGVASFTADVSYCGPLATRAEAELLLDRAEVLGLIDALSQRGLSGSRLGSATRWAIRQLLYALQLRVPTKAG